VPLRIWVTAMVLVMIPLPAQAISRYETMSMSCTAIHATIMREGAVILRWRSARNPSLPLYDRFVADDGFCPSLERATLTTVPAADTKACPVYNCTYFDPRDDFFLD
jgi:hypothetical protein